MSYNSFIKKISYSKLFPRFILRFLDELLVLPAMWIPGNGLRVLFNRLRGVKIGRAAWIGLGSILGNHPFLIEIGDRSSLELVTLKITMGLSNGL